MVDLLTSFPPSPWNCIQSLGALRYRGIGRGQVSSLVCLLSMGNLLLYALAILVSRHWQIYICKSSIPSSGLWPKSNQIIVHLTCSFRSPASHRAQLPWMLFFTTKAVWAPTAQTHWTAQSNLALLCPPRGGGALHPTALLGFTPETRQDVPHSPVLQLASSSNVLLVDFDLRRKRTAWNIPN